jgi:hypothetical protein
MANPEYKEFLVAENGKPALKKEAFEKFLAQKWVPSPDIKEMMGRINAQLATFNLRWTTIPEHIEMWASNKIKQELQKLALNSTALSGTHLAAISASSEPARIPNPSTSPQATTQAPTQVQAPVFTGVIDAPGQVRNTVATRQATLSKI